MKRRTPIVTLGSKPTMDPEAPGGFRMIRGGSLGDPPRPLCAARRLWSLPRFGWYDGFGFRVVLELK